jgi:hypothetical protein
VFASLLGGSVANDRGFTLTIDIDQTGTGKSQNDLLLELYCALETLPTPPLAWSKPLTQFTHDRPVKGYRA